VELNKAGLRVHAYSCIEENHDTVDLMTVFGVFQVTILESVGSLRNVTQARWYGFGIMVCTYIAFGRHWAWLHAAAHVELPHGS
jgi:hypothetical protein